MMDQAKTTPFVSEIQCLAWLWHKLPFTMMARASNSHEAFILTSFDFIRPGLVACDLFPYKVSPHNLDQATVVGCGMPVGCQSSSFSICWNASKSSRQSASSSSTDRLPERVSLSDSSPFSESLSVLDWPPSAGLGASSCGLTSTTALMSSGAALMSSWDGATSSWANSSSSAVLVWDWPTGSNEVGVVASVVQSSSATCTSAPENTARVCVSSKRHGWHKHANAHTRNHLFLPSNSWNLYNMPPGSLFQSKINPFSWRGCQL